MTYPGRRPDVDPVDPAGRDYSDPAAPGAIERDVPDPAVPDPRAYPRTTSSPRGIAAATIAVAIILLAVIAFSFLGNGPDDQVTVAPEAAPVEGTIDQAPTASISPDGDAAIPPIQPNNSAEPVETAPAN
ncbi:hypothetical protein [Aquibium oceanicum]|uniref:hypothetical protein n=1 Tax=Aquibium oceanicum TaxID=1670800 RepID=UPI000ADA6ABD|nr:hypothetical protein [Aquibium oceanicum]